MFVEDLAAALANAEVVRADCFLWVVFFPFPEWCFSSLDVFVLCDSSLVLQ